MASVIFESGAVATVINSLLSPRELSRIRIDTTGGTLEVDHLYGYSDNDWTFTPLRGEDDPWTASAGQDVPSNHDAQINRLVDDLLTGRTHDTTLTSTRPTMEFVTALYASAIAGEAVRRADLTPDHLFYQALNGGLTNTRISESFSI